ncbi:LDCC motif putative metal-binding protein [Anaerotignum sp.]|uniref:LDCC motif putative metal-binding protein n=1 Tax=Anaerotignum sp. TaxID=2039241 RepID=UPI0027150268|nr:LDCC motif putative metal-binding protein [Anaerotignum sp.]
MKIWNRMKQAFENYFKQMEKSNKELFGNSTADCCSLNRRQSGRQGNQKKQ